MKLAAAILKLHRSTARSRLGASASRTAIALCLIAPAHVLCAQRSGLSETPQQQLERLEQSIQQTEAQVEQSQRQLLELKNAVEILRLRLASTNPETAAAPAISAATVSPQPSLNDLRDSQSMQQSQIATLDQSKVESASKYPVKLSGLILLNGFVNTSQVDIAAAPTLAIPGGGSTGAALRQTVLGIDVRGPTLTGASSHADVRVDFFGAANTVQSAYGGAGGLLRLRTAHATLDWAHTQAFVELDRPIFSPYSPTSLVSIAEPALAWSGNLWTWNPQAGISHTLGLSPSTRLTLEAAVIDVGDPPALASSASSGNVSQSERSRWPGSELRLALAGNDESGSPSIGLGGYFSPHQTVYGAGYNAWAGTLDLRLPLPAGLQMTGSFYRGAALGGLGGGTYQDYLYAPGETTPLDDTGGWAQLKKRAGTRLEFNAAVGLDNAFAAELRGYATGYPSQYPLLARNRTFFANAIYSPRASLLFSVEVRHIVSTPIAGASANSNVIGIAAGYKF